MKDVRGALSGELAAALTAELAAPMQGLRDRLALLVDHIDRYIGESTGPDPYPWQSLQGLRHELGGAYLEANLLMRQLGDVRAVLLAPEEITAVDCAHEVELALNLLAMKHGNVELIADVGVTPPVRAAAGALALVVTRLLWLCAQSAQDVAASAISVRTWAEGEAVWISIADRGRGLALPEHEAEAVHRLLASWGATLDAIVAPGRGGGFELRLHVATLAG